MWRRGFEGVFRCGLRCLSDFLRVSEEVAAALNEGEGVVALESTVITHGMRYPENVRTAKRLESIVRDGGCVPATVAVADGSLVVGISNDLIERLASTPNPTKVSRRDLAVALSRGSLGGTTVSSTMIAARAAGISVFATGGIGGVHRGVEESWDISSDLTELGRTPVAVVCAGVKSILDVPKTLEFLETQGVPVIAYSSSDDWPGFFAPSSGCKAPYSSQDPEELAEFIDTARRLHLSHGFVIGVPIPETESELATTLQLAVDRAVTEAESSSIRGCRVTPFVLKRLTEITGGLSLKANVALIKNNASVAARIARALSDLNRKRRPSPARGSSSSTSPATTTGREARVVVIGGSVVDFYIETQQSVHDDGGTRAGSINQVCGGVGRNHADALTRLGVSTIFVSAIGRDQCAEFVQSYTSHVNLEAVKRLDSVPTATYAGITVNGELRYGVASMEAHDSVTVEWVRRYESSIAQSRMVVLDGNIPEETIAYACEVASSNGVPVWFDPTDQSKCSKICSAKIYRKLSYISPNFNEFRALLRGLHTPGSQSLSKTVDAATLFDFLIDNAHILLEPESPLQALIITMGPDGVLLLHKGEDSYELHHYAAPVARPDIINVSGAGDCFNAGVIRTLVTTPTQPITWATSIGLACASASLRSQYPVPPNLPIQQTIGDVYPTWSRSKRR